jgi:aldose 1-epimerase
MGTPFDFRTAASIGARLSLDDPQLSIAGGFDHNYVLRREADGLAHSATLRDPVSGRVLDIHTTEPGLQFYGRAPARRAGRRRARAATRCLYRPVS